jgi:hypothetical protein
MLWELDRIINKLLNEIFETLEVDTKIPPSLGRLSIDYLPVIIFLRRWTTPRTSIVTRR